MRGIYNSAPPKPRYSYTWDINQVLNYFSDQINSSLILADLAIKTVTLLALATMLRCAEISVISFHSIKFSQGAVSFRLLRPRKTQRSGPNKSISVRKLSDDRICPVMFLEAYLTATAWLRRQEDLSLFIATLRPHKAIGVSTVGRWIKNGLRAAAIDVSVFSAHSTRGAGASGVPVESILKRASWASSSTFSRFYNRSVGSRSQAQGRPNAAWTELWQPQVE